MPSWQLVITDEAASDIADARRFYQERAGLGAAFVSEIEKQLQFIELYSEARPKITHGIRRSAVKRFPYNIY
uniref:ParE toxin of type II toxin-antitoxin system, parDE n=1 Tax=Candidatus Kentrum sp. DK TaxID=2126562 RepID=A0A450SU44_9GAMM|nr:MAG: hypothetical protein BECKDK2373C_GA0170839_104011 [Candidatus Kentron sp. DK]VFJ57428.1 MAG: hypothetical protein BECKDK2373B_GA0170837_106617 [Candidatus Kentron sp. DK]